jgi:hypothetical protein
MTMTRRAAADSMRNTRNEINLKEREVCFFERIIENKNTQTNEKIN